EVAADELPVVGATEVLRSSCSRSSFFAWLHGFSGVQPQVLAGVSAQPATISGGAARRARTCPECGGAGAPGGAHVGGRGAARNGCGGGGQSGDDSCGKGDRMDTDKHSRST